MEADMDGPEDADDNADEEDPLIEPVIEMSTAIFAHSGEVLAHKC